jgi:putative endonuclease
MTTNNFKKSMPARRPGFDIKKEIRSIRRSPWGQIAQLVEQRTENPCVGGSTPPLATILRSAALRALSYGWRGHPRSEGCPAKRRAKQGQVMFHVYLLRSDSNPKKTHVGFTEQEIESRLTDHNCGRIPHTARHRPWHLIAVVSVQDKFKALDLERYFKSGSGHAFAHKHLW